MVKYFCDRCGKEMPGEGWTRLGKDVCDECRDLLDDALDEVKIMWEKTSDTPPTPSIP